jgi:hypothetical protein
MHVRRLVCFLLGAWLGGSFFMTMVATQNFRSVDRLLMNASPTAEQHIKSMGGREEARRFLRYSVSEQNRWYFETWESAQFAIGAAVFLLLLLASHEGKFALGMALAPLLVLIVQRFLLTPQIVAVGRTLDFASRQAVAGSRLFWVLHSAYSAVEILKWALIAILAGRLVWRWRRRSGDARQQVDLIDEADHRHIDR